MPAPAAPTSLSLSQPTDGNPTGTLSWQHDDIDLDRFEILRKLTGESVWSSYLLGPKADFGTAPNFSLALGAPLDSQWAVRALSSAGEVSA